MAYEQPNHQEHPYGQQQAAAGPGSRDGTFTQPSTEVRYAEWDNATQQPEAVPQWHQPPSAQAVEGIAKAHHWVASHHTGKTTFSEPVTDSGTTVVSYPPYSPSSVPQKPAARIFGVKKNEFFIVVAVGVFFLVIAIATGLGVGLGLGRQSASTAAAPAETSSSSSPTSTTPTGTTTTSPTTTKISPTPYFTGTVTIGPIECPRDNGKVFISQITSKPFNIECGHDYNSIDGTKDLSHEETSSMATCINLCGSTPGCVGAGWGMYQGTPTCWMKSELGEPNQSENWYFAKLQSLTNTTNTRRWSA